MTAPDSTTSSTSTTIALNGQPHATSATTVLQLVADLLDQPLQADGSSASGARLGVAVAVNSAVVPRAQWQATPITAGQRIEIVTAKQGG